MANNVVMELVDLIVPLEPLAPDQLLEDVAERFMDKQYANVLSLPIVDDGRPLGMISRYRFTELYLHRYGRELYGKREVRSFVNTEPLLVAHDQPLAEAALHVTGKMSFPLTEDFIITDNGRYVGVGFVVDLLKAMETQLRANSDELGQAYSRLKSSQLALVQSEKMASLGQMVAGLAHEINTPLGYVQNNVAMGQDLFSQVQVLLAGYEALFDNLLDEQSDPAQVAAQMSEVAALRAELNAGEMLTAMGGLMSDSRYGISQIAELVRNLKNFSRMDAAASDRVSLNGCIESALNIGRNVMKHCAVVKQLGDIPPLLCAPSQLNQVFLNLLTNAAHALDGKGQITIRTWHEGDAVQASIEDTGKGIAPEILGRIFDPFFTTKPVGEGTGLGLAISQQIIRQHGGEIKVESRLGVGTCFNIRLPLNFVQAVG